jgi:peptidyl-prolyl cis-trans isomerase C
MNGPTQLSTLVLLMLLGGAAAPAAHAANSATARPPVNTAPLFSDKIVAEGKGFQIRQSQVDEMYIAFKGHRAAVGEAVPEDARARVESEILEKLIATQLFLHRATEQDKSTAKQIADKFLADQKKNVPSDDSFRRQLLAVGMTPDGFNAQVREQAIVKAVIDREIKAGKQITEAEAQKFYDANPSMFVEPGLIRASHILIATRDKISGKPFTPEIKLQKRQLAEKILVRARSGEDFAKLVKEFSEDNRSKERGGEYTFARAKDDPRRAMAPEFEAAAFSMSPNQISDIVETGFGYHIIKTLEKLPARKIEYSKVADRIKDTLLREAVEKELPGYIEKLKKEAGVQILASDNRR